MIMLPATVILINFCCVAHFYVHILTLLFVPPINHFLLLYIRPPPAGDKSRDFIRALIKKIQVASFTQIIFENVHCPPLAGEVLRL